VPDGVASCAAGRAHASGSGVFVERSVSSTEASIDQCEEIRAQPHLLKRAVRLAGLNRFR
jgi:hypothetical protein